MGLAQLGHVDLNNLEQEFLLLAALSKFALGFKTLGLEPTCKS